MSDVTFICPHCNKHLSASDDMEGSTISCPSCQNLLTIPIHIIIPEDPPPAHTIDAEDANTCPYCRMPITEDDAIAECAACHTPHHQECWEENKGCTVFGCPEAPEEEEKISVAPALTAARSTSGHAAAAQPPPVQKKNAPGATSSLVWGILGFFICGPIFGIVAISNANKAKKLVQQQPDVYTGDGIATAGLVMGIIDLVAWGLVFLGRIAGAN